MIRQLDNIPTLFEKIGLHSYSFTCDKCGVLIATCFDWAFNDDYQVEEYKVTESIITCGKCKEK